MTFSTPFQRYFPLLHLLTRVVVRVFAPRFHVVGRGHVPYRGPFIIAPNHSADVDPPLVAAALITRPLWFMAKRNLFDIPILGKGMRFYQAFPVEPGEPDREALRYAADLLKGGQPLVIFPEGRISQTGEMGKILPGAMMLALRSGEPVIPCGIAGSPCIMPYGQFVPRPTLRRVTVVFGPPLQLDDLEGLPRRQAREVATERLETAIKACVAQAKRG